MKSENENFETLVLDGQVILVPADATFWDRLRADPDVDGVPVIPGSFKYHLIDLMRSRLIPGMKMGLGVIGLKSPLEGWRPYCLDIINGSWERVYVLHLECDACHWKGLALDARDFDLTVGVPEATSARRRIAALPNVPCPRCGAYHRRMPVLWITDNELPPSPQAAPTGSK